MFLGLWIHQNHHRFKAVDLSRQKELDADPKTIQQMEFVGELKKLNGTDVGHQQSMFFINFRKKRLNSSQD